MLLWLEGFETLSSDSIDPPVGGGLQRRYETFTGSIETLTDVGGLEIQAAINQGAVSGYQQELITASLPSTDQGTFVVGFAVRPANLFGIGASGGSGAGFSIHNDDGEQIKLEFVDYSPANAKPGGVYYKLAIMRGATELARSDQAFPVTTAESDWMFFEWKVVIDNTTGSFEVRYRRPADKSGSINTITWDSASTNVDTQNQSSTLGNRLGISWDTGSASRRLVYDHIYLLDSTGSKNNDFLGNLLIEGKPGTGDGNQTDWVLAGGALSHEDAWHENASTVNDDKRVTSDVTNDVSLMALQATSIIRDNIVAVMVTHQSRMESATGSLTLHHRYRRAAGGETDGGSYLVDTTVPGSFSDVQEDDPNTATDWTITDLDALEVGVRNGG